MDGKARSICLTLPALADQAGPGPAHACRITLTQADLASIKACARRAKACRVRGVVLDFASAEFLPAFGEAAGPGVRHELVVSHTEGRSQSGHAVFQVREWRAEGQVVQSDAVSFPLDLEETDGAIIRWLQARYPWSLPVRSGA